MLACIIFSKSRGIPFTQCSGYILVQESIKEDFIQKLQQQWKSKVIEGLQRQ
ncbi:hypothetical protein DOY81_012239 [Sarcophaga bullata]|nr:hypothetical protein DOY81_012239 [Sarcophaga bullata]